MEIVYSLDGLEDYLLRVARGSHGREIFLDRFLENAVEVDVDAICDGEDVWIGGVMQHVEEAGIHSATRPACCRRTRSGSEMLARSARPRATSRSRSASSGLINVQYGVLRRGPVRDRGQPARVADGPVRLQGDRPAAGQARLPRDAGREARDAGLPDDPCGDHVSVKEAVLPFDRFSAPTRCSARDALDRRGDGVAADFPAAFAKAQAAAGTRLPRTGTVFLTVTDSDKAARSASPRSCTTSASDRRDARDGGGDLAHGHPGRAAEQDRRGLAARRRLDRARRRRPRHQHPDRHRRAHRRLRDPRRGDRPRDPLHHDAVRGMAAARAIAAARPARRGRVAAGAPRAGLGDQCLTGTPGARFGRRLCPVVSHVAIGAYDVISVLDAEGPPPDPGQFYMLAASERWGGGADERPFLPRAFSVLRRHEDGRLEFLFENVGPGTRRLCELRAGDGLWLLGPLGVGFRAPRGGRRPLLVGGGVGIAPLAIWQDAIGAPALLGLPRRAARRGRRAAARRRGRHGRRLGRPSRARHRTAQRGARPRVEVYACGPPPMLEAVRALCAARASPAQARAESGMACGYGACFGCVVADEERLRAGCASTGRVLDADTLDEVIHP
jgi:NAD(P)H-flavin reductase